MKIKDLRSYDIFGNIALVKFSDKMKVKDKKIFANKILKNNKSVKTVLEKVGKFKGRLRKMQTKYVVGEKTKEIRYRENGCVFRFNIDKTYFSSRLSGERKEIAGLIKKGENVLVIGAGVGPYSIVIAKNSKALKIDSNEINREANKYGLLNVELNKVKEKVEIIPGDIKKVALKLKNKKKKYNSIIMTRPQLKDSFLKEAFMLSKKGTKIYYYDFCKIEDIDKIVEKVNSEAKKNKKKIKILRKKIAGEIGPYRARLRVDFRVL
jgi:tRNA (guanine37-N1)-methyltransferase